MRKVREKNINCKKLKIVLNKKKLKKNIQSLPCSTKYFPPTVSQNHSPLARQMQHCVVHCYLQQLATTSATERVRQLVVVWQRDYHSDQNHIHVNKGGRGGEKGE